MFMILKNILTVLVKNNIKAMVDLIFVSNRIGKKVKNNCVYLFKICNLTKDFRLHKTIEFDMICI